MNPLTRSLILAMVVCMVAAALAFSTLLKARLGWPAVAAACVLFLASTCLALWMHRQ